MSARRSSQPSALRRPSVPLFSPTFAGDGDLSAHFRETLTSLNLDAKDVDAIAEFCFSKRISAAAFRIIYKGCLMQLEEPPVHAKDPPVVTPAFPRRQTAPSIPYSATSRSKKSLFSRSNTPGNRSKYYSAVGITRNDAPPDPPVDAPLPPAPVVIPPTFGEGASSSDSSDREDDRSDSDQARTPSASVHNDSFDEVSMLHDGADQGRFRHSIGSDATAGVVSPMMSPSDSPKFDLVTRSWSNANLSELVPEYGRQTPSLPVDVLINCAEDMFRSSFAGDFGLDVDECVEVTSPTGGAVVFDPISIPFAQDVMIPPPSSGACDVNTVTVTTAPVDDFNLPPFPPNPITPLVSALPPKPVPLGPKRLVPSRLDTDRGRNEFVSWEQVRSDLSTLFPVAPTSPDANLALSTVTTTPEEPEGVTSLSSRLQQLWAGGGGPMGTGTPPTVIGSSNTSPPRVAFDTDLRASGDSSNYEGRTQADIGRDLVSRGRLDEAAVFLERAAQSLSSEVLMSSPDSPGVKSSKGALRRTLSSHSSHSGVSRLRMQTATKRPSTPTGPGNLREISVSFDEGDEELSLEPVGTKQRSQVERTRYRIQVANDLMACGRPFHAVPLYLQVLWEEPKHPEVLWGLAQHYLNEGRADLAFSHLKQLRSTYPACPDIMLACCRARVFTGDALGAIKLLSACIDDKSMSAPSNGALCGTLHRGTPHASLCDMYFVLGQLFALTNHHRKAVGCFEAARRLVPCGWPLAVAFEAVSLASAEEEWISKAIRRCNRLQKDILCCSQASMLLPAAGVAHPALAQFPQAMKPVVFPSNPGPYGFPSELYVSSMKTIALRCASRVCQLVSLSSNPSAAFPLLQSLLEQATLTGSVELRALVLECCGVVYYRLDDISGAQTVLEKALGLGTGFVPPSADSPHSFPGETPAGAAFEWNADGRYSSSADGMEPLALPVVSHQPMPVAAYFLSAVYSRVHAAGKKGKPRGPAGGAQKMWANAAIVLLRQAMDEGWRKLVGAEVESAAEIWAHLWNVYELRHISADSVNLGAVPAELL